MRYYKTFEQVRSDFNERKADALAKLEAWEQVTINEKHKTLTARAIEGGRIDDYLSIGKAIYINYRLGHRYLSDDLTMYSYEGEDGASLGAEGFTRISRTLTPREASEELAQHVEKLRQYVADLETDEAQLEEVYQAYAAARKAAVEIEERLKTGAAKGALNK